VRGDLSEPSLTDDDLARLQRDTFKYCADEVNPENGLVRDSTRLYVLGFASPTVPLPPESYKAWTRTYKWKKLYEQEFVYAGPLFIHHLSHMWIDFRGIQDDYMCGK
jgi:hypothetical protein